MTKFFGQSDWLVLSQKKKKKSSLKVKFIFIVFIQIQRLEVNSIENSIENLYEALLVKCPISTMPKFSQKKKKKWAKYISVEFGRCLK